MYKDSMDAEKIIFFQHVRYVLMLGLGNIVSRYDIPVRSNFSIIDAKFERSLAMSMPSDDLITSLLTAPPTILALLLGLGAIAVVGLALRIVLHALSKETER